MAEPPAFNRPIAHRGLHDRAAGIIENSRSAFARAIERGFAIECDLQLTSDGVPVVFHDDAMHRLTGREGLVSDATAAEITQTPLLGSIAGDTPQRLSELLEQVDGKVLLQIELKQQRGSNTVALARAAAEGLSRYRGPVVIESFDPRLIASIRHFGFTGARGIITERYDAGAEGPKLSTIERFGLRNLLHWPWTRFDFVSCDLAAVNLPILRFLRFFGMPFTIWTVRSLRESAEAVSCGGQIVFEGFDPEIN